MESKIKNGDVFYICQTVNGVSKFLWFNSKWYYFEERLSREYEYDQEALTKHVLNESGLEEFKFIINIFEAESLKEKAWMYDDLNK